MGLEFVEMYSVGSNMLYTVCVRLCVQGFNGCPSCVHKVLYMLIVTECCSTQRHTHIQIPSISQGHVHVDCNWRSLYSTTHTYRYHQLRLYRVCDSHIAQNILFVQNYQSFTKIPGKHDIMTTHHQRKYGVRGAVASRPSSHHTHTHTHYSTNSAHIFQYIKILYSSEMANHKICNNVIFVQYIYCCNHYNCNVISIVAIITTTTST